MARLNIMQGIAGLFGYKLIRKSKDQLVYIHEYKQGYEQYKEEQIFHNKRKLEAVWADETTLATVANYLGNNSSKKKLRGICHGARNGFEVDWFNKNSGYSVIGTDISETAVDFPNMVVWDFHEENPEWAGKMDFVYTNSLDQAMEPDKALAAWATQLNKNGYIFIEHTMAHSAAGASSMDPFGAHPMCMPYLFFQWGRGKYELCDIVKIDEKKNKKMEAWLFVLKKV
jgi:hypothetical protein